MTNEKRKESMKKSAAKYYKKNKEKIKDEKLKKYYKDTNRPELYEQKKKEKYELVLRLSEKIFEDKAENFEPIPICVRELMLNLTDDDKFIKARLTAGSSNKIVIRIKGKYEISFRVVKKELARLEDRGLSCENVLAILNCYNYSKEEAKEKIEYEKDKYIPFFDCWLELRSAIDHFMTYGIHYVEL